MNCSIDATNNTRLGRYINDAPVRDPECNCLPKAYYIDGVPHILVFAAKDILADEELRYDYGTGDLPWRTNKKVLSSPHVESDAVLSHTPLNVSRVKSHVPQTSSKSRTPLNVSHVKSHARHTSVNSHTPLNVSRVKSHAPPIESVKKQSNSVNSHESMSGACKKVRKSASRNSSSVKNKKPLIGATVIRSASEKVKRHPTSTCVMPFRATSVVNSASGEVKKQSNAGHDESQASATEINSAFNTDIEPGLYYVHPETGILYQYGEEDAQEYCVGEERAEYFQANAPMVRF